MVLLLCTKTSALYIGCNWDKIETNVCFPRVVEICQALKFLLLIVPVRRKKSNSKDLPYEKQNFEFLIEFYILSCMIREDDF